MLQLLKKVPVISSPGLPKEEFLERKRKKKWFEMDAKNHCLFIYPRALCITWVRIRDHLPENCPWYWDWKCFKETSEENIEVVKLVSICWLDVRGGLPLTELSAGVTYEVAYELKLTKNAAGWEFPLEVKLYVTGKEEKKRCVSILDKPRGEWFELKLGTFIADHTVKNGEVQFYLKQVGGHWKSGLIFKGVVFRPAQKHLAGLEGNSATSTTPQLMNYCTLQHLYL